MININMSQSIQSIQYLNKNDEGFIFKKEVKKEFNLQIKMNNKKEQDVNLEKIKSWTAEDTAKRIVDFAKKLAGEDNSKFDLLFDAFRKGFKEAEKIWGGKLPEISYETYNIVEEEFEKLMEEKDA